jgi:hypothetical protein
MARVLEHHANCSHHELEKKIARLRYEGWKRKRHCRLQEAARKLPKPSAWSAFPPAPGEQDQQCRHRQAEHLAPPLPESKTQGDACPYGYAADYGDGAGGLAQPITPQPMEILCQVVRSLHPRLQHREAKSETKGSPKHQNGKAHTQKEEPEEQRHHQDRSDSPNEGLKNFAGTIERWRDAIHLATPY